jgi:hypothetical protein
MQKAEASNTQGESKEGENTGDKKEDQSNVRDAETE